jgi:hypothetical protein
MSHIGRWTATGGGTISAGLAGLAGHPVLAAVVGVLLVVANGAVQVVLRRQDPEHITAMAMLETARAAQEIAKEAKDATALVAIAKTLHGGQGGTGAPPSSATRRLRKAAASAPQSPGAASGQ